MEEKLYRCPNCGKTYRRKGKWLMRHMVEKCHVMSLKPEILYNIDLQDIVKRLTRLEQLIKFPMVHTSDPIERIKREEAKKITDPSLAEYRRVFAECIAELKEVLAVRKRAIDANDLELREVD